MAFGFSVTDFVHLFTATKNVVNACRDGPKEYKELCSEVRALSNIIQRLQDDLQEPDSLLSNKGPPRKRELSDIIDGARQALAQSEKLINANSSVQDGSRANVGKRVWHSYRVGSADLDILTGRMTFYVACINAFLQSLEGSAIARIERRVDQIYEKLVEQDMAGTNDGSRPVSTVSVAESLRSRLEMDSEGVWKQLKAALEAEAIPKDCLATYKDDVVAYLQEKLSSDLDIVPAEHVQESRTSDSGTKRSHRRRFENLSVDNIPLETVDFKSLQTGPAQGDGYTVELVQAVRGAYAGFTPCCMVVVEVQIDEQVLGMASAELRIALEPSIDAGSGWKFPDPESESIEQLTSAVISVLPRQRESEFRLKCAQIDEAVDMSASCSRFELRMSWINEVGDSISRPRARFGVVLTQSELSWESITAFLFLRSRYAYRDEGDTIICAKTISCTGSNGKFMNQSTLDTCVGDFVVDDNLGSRLSASTDDESMNGAMVLNDDNPMSRGLTALQQHRKVRELPPRNPSEFVFTVPDSPKFSIAGNRF